MKIDLNKFAPLNCGITPCYRFKEGDKKRERYWIDSQNCEYYFQEDDPELSGFLEDGRKHYIISMFKPKGIIVTDDNFDSVVRYFCYFWT